MDENNPPPTNETAEALPRRGPADRLLLLVGSLGYLGFVPVASGTVAVAVVGIPLYLLMAIVLTPSWPAYVVAVILFTLGAVYVAQQADRILDEKDSKKNVIDELPGYLFSLVGLPVTWQLVAAAFFIERAIDIAKIWPANWIERKLPGGWGVVLDDVVAGLYTLGILRAGLWLAPAWFGVEAAGG
ncbi:MAG: phosphatidylglycerophosphatase A [Phycisphaerae bacterium]